MNNPNAPSKSKSAQEHNRRRRIDFTETMQQKKAENLDFGVDIGQRLRELRMERGISIRDLARKSNLNVNTVSAIEDSARSFL